MQMFLLMRISYVNSKLLIINFELENLNPKRQLKILKKTSMISNSKFLIKKLKIHNSKLQ